MQTRAYFFAAILLGVLAMNAAGATSREKDNSMPQQVFDGMHHAGFSFYLVDLVVFFAGVLITCIGAAFLLRRIEE